MAAVDRRPELAVAQAGIDQHVVAAAVGDDQVGDAVAVQVGQLHGAGVEQAGGSIGQDGRIAGAVIDDHAIEALVGVDDVLGAVAGQVGHGQLDGLVGLVVGLERAVAVAQQHQDVAVGVADEQVELAVAVDVGDGQAVGFGPAPRKWSAAGSPPGRCRDRCSTHRRSRTARSVDAVAVEVGHADDLGRARGLDGDGIGEAASAQAGEHVRACSSRG